MPQTVEMAAFVNVVVASICFRQPFAPVLHPSADSELPVLQPPLDYSDWARLAQKHAFHDIYLAHKMAHIYLRATLFGAIMILSAISQYKNAKNHPVTRTGPDRRTDFFASGRYWHRYNFTSDGWCNAQAYPAKKAGFTYRSAPYSNPW